MATAVLILPPVQLIPICWWLEMTASVLMAKGGWQEADRGVVWGLIIGSTVGVPFGLMLKALDDLCENEVYICTGSSPNYALWGELMSMAASNRGAVGAVVNGYSRDTRGILAQNFPVFSHGRYSKDQRPRGKVIDVRCTIEIESVRVRPGDIVFGDLDGVCIIPREIEEEVFRRSWEKAHGEKQVFEAIKNGMGAQAAWDKFGIM